MRPLLLSLVAALLLGPGLTARAHEGHRESAAPPPAPSSCTAQPTLPCAHTAAPVFADDGALWLAWAQGGHVWVGRSGDLGQTLTAVRVNETPQPIDDNGENRPKLAVQGTTVAVTYTVKKPGGSYAGEVLVSRSTDGGLHFSPPHSLSDETKSVSQRFDAIALSPSGRLYAAWIDKRRSDSGAVAAALALAWSDDGGAHVSPSRIAADHSCECCRLAMALDSRGLPVIAWRHVFTPNIRDHAILSFIDADTPGGLQRVSDDDWAVDACPHHGPALAIGGGDVRHMAWFTQGKRRRGLFYAHAQPDGAFSPPLAVGNPRQAPGHPAILAVGHAVVLAWKEFSGTAGEIHVMTSPDDGASWSEPRRVATSAGASDHPLLVRRGDTAFLSWLTAREGYRLLPVTRDGGS